MVLDYLEQHYNRHRDELKAFIAIPSISTSPEHGEDMKKTARWLADHLAAMGLNGRVMETARHPVVYGEWTDAVGKPTLLIYGHYDVQPPEPLDLWESPPFELAERGEYFFARGVSDDKGQLFVHLKAIEAYLKTEGRLPVNVKLILEGEEEIGSPSLPAFLAANRNLLAASVAVISDNPMLGIGMPAVGYGLRGLAYAEVLLDGPHGDLHSGRFGGAIANPANALCKMLGSLKDERNRIAVPGFYDAVRPLAPEERETIRNLPIGEQFYKDAAGVEALAPEEGYTAIECIWARPSMDINGLTAGFQGEGAKTVLPAKARAKVSFRLVPDQDPDAVLDALEAHLKNILPPGIRMTFVRHEGAFPAMVDRSDPMLETARKALEAGFGKPCWLIRQGGTIPVVSLMKKVLGLNALLLGFGLPDENAHAPNERLLVENFRGGMRAIAALYRMLGEGR
jgi:acetylornithine deacetylase/succinyl-diaminopimelate desuccinylase-like protein